MFSCTHPLVKSVKMDIFHVNITRWGCVFQRWANGLSGVLGQLCDYPSASEATTTDMGTLITWITGSLGCNDTVWPRYDTYLDMCLTIRSISRYMLFFNYLTYSNSNLSMIEHIIQKRYILRYLFLYHDAYLDVCITIYRDTRWIFTPILGADEITTATT